MLKKIQNWLANPKRKYSEGLKYFNQFASPKQKENFGKFLNVDDDDKISHHDLSGRFPVLINQVVFCERKIKSNPEAFKDSTFVSGKIVPFVNTEENKSEQENSGEGPAQNSVKAITDLSQLPENFAPVVTRLKELVPFMAKVHADMAAEVADDKRAVLRAELIALDDERRGIWNRINKYLSGIPGSEIEKDSDEKEVEQNMLVIGVDLAKRIGLLKSYIKNNSDSLKKHQEAGNEKKAATSQEKIEKYTKELEELEALLPKE